MEQHRTRPPQYGTRRGEPPPLPPQAARAASARPQRPARPGRTGAPPRGGEPQRRPASVRPSGPPLLQAVRRMPNPRLTGLGGGLFCGGLMFLLGCVDALLFGSSLTVYGVLFVPVCALTALWIRRGDLLTAPIIVPIAFTAGLFPVADNTGGVSGRLMGLFTALATQAGWLYGGTFVAGLIATVRKVHLMARRAAAARNRPPA
ncbi:hypothetical protein K4B79_11820 [Streptomyces lincolnensis]|uniref:DUF6542 domain-containing protein n=1 Tax=Streptomyces lincolnensis TaxID=1915 RepID=UPI001E28A864|nr:DUF6542 domain-containing protein [Streptomyces lincolnensis]MCD7438910.1 hypothetical protein [Streptomyces lincolnensis]